MTRLFLSVFATALLVDRIFKIFVPDFCAGFLCFEKSFNSGAFLGMMQGYTILFIALSLVIGFVILFFYSKIRKSLVIDFSFALILAGVAGNLIDRIFYNSVIDFVKIRIFPAFNLADLFNVAGALLLIIALVRKEV